MKKKWDLLKFSDIWNKQGWSKSIEYKNSFVPSSLYKYSPLFDKTEPYNQFENDKRLKSLQEKKLWVSNYKYLNDPFEFKSLFLDSEKIKKYGWRVSDLEKCLEFAKNLAQIGCFSNYGVNNMPLWAHYANNHKGYCVKYKLLKKDAIYPVTYIKNREAIATIPTQICSMLRKGFNKGEEPNKDLWKYLISLYISFSCKFEHWEYEDEFRIFNIEKNIDEGTLITFSQANIDIKKIYMGIYCQHKAELIEIGKFLGCEVYEITFNEHSKKFSLKTNRVV